MLIYTYACTCIHATKRTHEVKPPADLSVSLGTHMGKENHESSERLLCAMACHHQDRTCRYQTHIWKLQWLRFPSKILQVTRMSGQNSSVA